MKKILLLLVLLATIYSCEKENYKSSKEPSQLLKEEYNVEGENENITSPQESSHLLKDEYNTEGENEITINFESSINLNINDPRLTIAVYGHNVNIAGGSATLITRQNFQITSIPSSLTLKLPTDSHKLINPETKKEDSRFYLGIDWDSDNNDQRCAGDISFDYNKKSSNIDLESTITQTYYMQYIPSTTPCF